MSALEVVAGRPLRGRLRPPGDKSVSHRAVLLGALAHGTTRIAGLADGDDVARTAGAVRALGAEVSGPPPGRAGDVLVTGGRPRLHPAGAPLDLGNSGTSMRLLAGVCASFPWETVLVGDASLGRRPMDRVARPLRAMGAAVAGTGEEERPPLTVRGGRLSGIDYTMPVASAQVKGAVLLAGLAARGDTVVREAVRTRAHTEELLAAAGADLDVSPDGRTVRVRACELQPFEVAVPADPSQAAFWVVAACVTPGSDVVVEGVYVGPGRAGFLDVLGRMGALVDVERRDASTADVRARFGPLAGTDVGGDEVPGVIDEIPVLAVAAAVAEGPTAFRDAGELRVKESDRVAAMASGLAALGAGVEPLADGLVVAGGSRLRGAPVGSGGDHRVAMALAVAGLAASGVTTVGGWEAVATSYPGFEEDLRRLCGHGR